MSYRVEVASSGRAGCQSTDCKKAGTKIGKGELRLGTWVDIPDRGGSWRWRHWGCVTGKILQNIRNTLDHNGSGDYTWDALDGYYGADEKSSLEHFPDLQDKVRRVVTQGYIDSEDFKGDPEMNKLGCAGLRSAASKKKPEKNKDSHTELTELKKQLDVLAAERQVKIANGASTSKIDTQLKALQNLLEVEEHVITQAKKQTTKKKSGKKRGHVGDESDAEDPNDFKEKTEKPVKKKRVSAKDKKISEEKMYDIPQAKTCDGKVIKGEENQISCDSLESRDSKSIKIESSTKIKEEQDNEGSINLKVEEEEKPIKPARGRSRKVKKEN
ncbi:putative zf-parp type zinc finger protein [Erysiphe necator]|uniref:Putative zf-parp type zinc finger protein n=1 Tax=Uncinula necator TaxID=52586 RepID=A0A0B1P9J5_UNCNE|nr:putative zf-parp type zinc finger protein [Erysiphe necator]